MSTTDLESCLHPRMDLYRRSEDTENLFRLTEKGRYRRCSERITRPGPSRPIAAPFRVAAGPVCSPDNSGPPSLSSVRMSREYRSAAKLDQNEPSVSAKGMSSGSDVPRRLNENSIAFCRDSISNSQVFAINQIS